jgi:hypothetical protein
MQPRLRVVGEGMGLSHRGGLSRCDPSVAPDRRSGPSQRHSHLPVWVSSVCHRVTCHSSLSLVPPSAKHDPRLRIAVETPGRWFNVSALITPDRIPRSCSSIVTPCRPPARPSYLYCRAAAGILQTVMLW